MALEIIAELIALIASLSIIGVNILYGVIAPWWKSTTGFSFMAVLTAFSFLVLAQISQAFLKEQPILLYSVEIFLGACIFGAMTWVGTVMVQAQLKNRKDTYKHSVKKDKAKT